MKIDSFVLDLHSESFKSSSSATTSFMSELDAQNTKRLEEAEALNAQLEFCKRLEFELIQQLLYAIAPCGCKPQEQSMEESFMSREISVQKEYSESQRLDVGMSGFIYTADKKIEINIDISMSSSFVSKHQISRTQFYDPLVLSFDGELPNLDSQSFSFDIDADGSEDQVSMLKGKNGFLALDKNANGKIDNGLEFFGMLNGDGFADLRRYDSDNNGWIDENDPILDSLRVWIKNRDEDRLVALGEVGIGAIYLGSTDGSFNLKSNANETLGRIRASGLYLNEDGTSGIMSQIDFARKNKEANKHIDASPLNEFLKSV